jgi:hypothetical protein
MTKTVGRPGWTLWALAGGVSLISLALASLFLGTYLQETVASRTAAFLVYLAWMALILGAAAAVGAAAVRWLFPGGFTTVAAQRDKDGPEADDFMDLKSSVSLFQPVAIYQSIAVVVFAVAFMFLAQGLSGGALFAFQTIQWEAMSRSNEPEQLAALFRDVEEMKRPQDVERFIKKLPLFFEHPEEAVRADALQTMAVMAQRMTLSVALLVRDGDLLENRWEPAVVQWLHQDVSPQLRALYDKGVTPRPNIVRALAWIQNQEDREFFVQLAQTAKLAEASMMEAAVGLGNLGGLGSGRELVGVALSRTTSSRIWALWSLQRIGEALEQNASDQELGKSVFNLLMPLLDSLASLDDSSLCGAVVAIKAFQHADTTTSLTELFESERGELVCQRIEMNLPFGPPVVFVPKEQLRWLLLNILADVGGGNAELSVWVSHMLNTRQFDDRLTKGLNQMYSEFHRLKKDE